MLAVALLAVVVLGIGVEIWTALHLNAVKDLRDVRELFGEPLAALIGALTTAIGFYFADRQR